MMYLIEGEKNGFTNIPTSIYWAIVTMTTVGYGDISPGTPLGQFLASVIMILGYGIIAVPTGIVTAQMIQKSVPGNTQVCPNCMFDKHDDDAHYCKKVRGKTRLNIDLTQVLESFRRMVISSRGKEFIGSIKYDCYFQGA